eukprot:632844-Alexandrium_andersonii.AAC.1
MSPDLEQGLQDVHVERLQTAFLDQRPPVMPPDVAFGNVVQYGTPEQIQERMVARPQRTEIAQSVVELLRNVTT